MKNKRPHNKHTPYKLEINGKEYGCYAKRFPITQIILSMPANTQFKIYDLNDNVVDSS